MMIKCQKCGFENQMGSIFCRECGEKLNMDAIDPNKLRKDVDKEKLIKRTKKRIKGAISGAISLIVIAAFVFLVFPDLFPFGGLRQYEEPETTEAVAKQKFNAATTGTAVGKVKYSYPEINRMFKAMVVDPLAEQDSFAKVTNAEISYDEEKGEHIIYLWISIKDKVPVVYTIRGGLYFNAPDPTNVDYQPDALGLDVKRLDIGRLPLFVSTHSFLNGFSPLLQNDAIQAFFQRAKNVEFSSDGMTVEFSKGGPTSTYTPAPASNKPSSATAAAALKGGSAAAAEKNEAAKEAARQKAEAARQKAEEEKEKKRLQEEERKRKAEEYKQQQKEKEEERKRKLEEEKERKKQEAEEKKRQAEEEANRRRQEREDRRRERENDRYNNNGRSSRSSRSSRNNRW